MDAGAGRCCELEPLLRPVVVEEVAALVEEGGRPGWLCPTAELCPAWPADRSLLLEWMAPGAGFRPTAGLGLTEMGDGTEPW